jgi:hypothetical protein
MHYRVLLFYQNRVPPFLGDHLTNTTWVVRSPEKFSSHVGQVGCANTLFAFWDQGCQILLGTTCQNGGKIYQMTTKCTTKCTKWPYNVPFGRKIDNMVIKIPSSIARPSKIYPNWDFWFENIPSGNTFCYRKNWLRLLEPQCTYECRICSSWSFQLWFTSTF